MPTSRKSSKTPAKRNRARSAASPDAFAYRLDDASAMSGIGRSKLYALHKDDKLEFVKVGKMVMVSGDSLRRLLGVKEEATA